MVSRGHFFLRCARVYSHEQACASRFLFYAISWLCSAGDEQAAEPKNRRWLALGDAFAYVVAVALSAGHPQTGDSIRVAAEKGFDYMGTPTP